MPINKEEFDLIKARLAAYVRGWTAHAILQQSLTGADMVLEGQYNAIAQKVIEDAQAKNTKPKINDLILQIVLESSTANPIPWEKDKHNQDCKKLVIVLNGQVFKVKITRAEGSESGEQYGIEIKGKVNEADLTKFAPPALKDGGVTKITFDSSGRYIIDPGRGVSPIVNTAFPPRPLQLNAIRAYTEAIFKGDSKQLELLGTGTGKSFIVAMAAEAVGSSVVILPNADLAGELLNDAFKKKIFSNRMIDHPISVNVEGRDVEVMGFSNEKQTKPYAVLASDINDLNVFQALAARDDVNIVLNADHPLFKNFIGLVHDKLLLIDEVHQHAYTEEEASEIAAVCSDNATLALTATPTYPLFNAFGGSAAEFNLHNAMQARILRSLASEDVKLDAEHAGFVEQAVESYYKPVYLQPGDPGYVPLPKPPEKTTIESVLKNRVPPCQKAMIFSDDRTVLEGIHQQLTAIEEDSLNPEVMHGYQEKIRFARRQELANQLQSLNVEYTPEELNAAVPIPDLREEIISTRKEAIKNTVYGFALNMLLTSEDRDTYASQLRSKTLSRHDLNWKHYNGLKSEEDLEGRLAALHDFDNLTPEEQILMKDLISGVVIGLNERFQGLDPLHTTHMNEVVSFLQTEMAGEIDQTLNKLLEEYPSPTVALVNVETSATNAKATLARLNFGLETVALSDQRWSTGVSVKDVLTSIVVTNKPNFLDPNALCAPLGAAQAVGRAVRDKELRGMATIITSARIPDALIFTVEKILAKDSGEQSKIILQAWDIARNKYNEVYEQKKEVLGEEAAVEFATEEACKAATLFADGLSQKADSSGLMEERDKASASAMTHGHAGDMFSQKSVPEKQPVPDPAPDTAVRPGSSGTGEAV